MGSGWQPAEYARTCLQCGYTWKVPRWARRRRCTSLRMLSRLTITSGTWGSTDSTDLRQQVGSIEAQNQAIEAFERCPKCDADRFSQALVR